ncbi:hypothetical protein F888_03021 [Acinetobacter courvalinii]|nr:hypothetical protein F888_03021 [Acinetobacter courvalinii]
MSLFASKGELKSLHHDTVKILGNYLPLSVCDEIIKRFELIEKNANYSYRWSDALESNTRLWCFEKEIKELLPHFEVDRWIRASDAYTGRDTQSWCLMANRIISKENNLGSGGGLHRDSPFSHQIKFIWYLNDVNGFNGAFQYLPGTHTDIWWSRKLFPLGEHRFPNVETPNGMKEVHAKAGTLLICDKKCIHRGKPLQNGIRYILFMIAKV